MAPIISCPVIFLAIYPLFLGLSGSAKIQLIDGALCLERGFLFDIHGFGGHPQDIYLGTAGGQSLQNNFDRADFFKRHGLHGLLKAARHEIDGTLFKYRIAPADKDAEETQFSGGFTIRQYARITKINCIQIEIADTIRKEKLKRDFFIEDLAFATINFVRRHALF